MNKFNYFTITNTSIVKAKSKIQAEEIAFARRKEFKGEPWSQERIEITFSEADVAYKSDFTEAETVFWLEAVKDLIIKKVLKIKYEYTI
jgi:hypothetical protein